MMNCRYRTLCIATLFASAFTQPAHADSARSHPASEQEYWAQVDSRNWDDAVLAAEKLVDAARAKSNEAPEELADALSLLGRAQLSARNYLGAEAAYSEALQILQPRVVETSDKLLEPLRGMGSTLAYAGKHEEAVPYMERALLVSRRTEGLFNTNQEPILRQLATSLSRLGMYVEAEQHMQYLVRVGEQTYGAKDPRMSRIYDLLGDFYIQLGAITFARQAYENALKIVEKKLGRNDIATVMPLRAYAESFRRELDWSLYGVRTPADKKAALMNDHLTQPDGKPMNPRFLNTDGERALKRAIKTLDSHPNRPTALLYDTLLDLGDWYMIKGDSRRALPQYRRAMALLGEVEPDRKLAAKAKVSFPVQVYYPIPSAATRNLNRPDEDVEERYVHVAFTVNPDGSVSGERVIEANASPRHVNETLNAVRDARYRPKFVNGEPVATEDLSLRQIFKVRREREAG